MPHRFPPVTPISAAAYGLLQQELIDSRDRLDRQVTTLVRMTRDFTRLLRAGAPARLGQSLAEQAVDALDVEGAVAWCRGDAEACVVGLDSRASFAAPSPEWIAGIRAGDRAAVRLDEQACAACGYLAPLALVECIAAVALSDDGEVACCLVAGNTRRGTVLYTRADNDALAPVALLAQKFAAYLAHQQDGATIRAQVEALQTSEERLALVLEGTNDGWWDWDLVTDRCTYSARWWQMLGIPVEGRTQQFWRDRVHPDDAMAFASVLDGALDGGGSSLEAEARLAANVPGGWLDVLVRASIRRDDTGRATRLAGTALDLTERKRQEARIHRLAYFDALTDLPNRRQFSDRLAATLQQAPVGSSALLMVDLDRFKSVNDALGHDAGDKLLRAVAQRLLDTVRPGDLVARLGGDEFVVLLEGLGEDLAAAGAKANRVGEKLLVAMRKPVQLGKTTVHPSGSVGVALLDEEALSAEAALKRADLALFDAKQSGRDLARRFDPSMATRASKRALLESRLREALRAGELTLNYQVQVDAQRRATGAEALLRWRQPDGHMVSPAEFVPVAEETPLIHELGAFVTLSARARLQTWLGAGLHSDFRLAINVSAIEFLRDDFVERTLDLLGDDPRVRRHLTLELSEACVLTELDAAAARMERLIAAGVQFSLDDFGTGYSSLAYLRRLPFSELKIDRSYVQRILHDPHDDAIVRAMIAMCHALKLRVVAEGVETQEQAERLRELGCSYFQGFHFGRPAPAGERPPAAEGDDGLHPGA